MPFETKLNALVDMRALTNSALPKIVRITAVTLGNETDLKLFWEVYLPYIEFYRPFYDKYRMNSMHSREKSTLKYSDLILEISETGFKFQAKLIWSAHNVLHYLLL